MFKLLPFTLRNSKQKLTKTLDFKLLYFIFKIKNYILNNF
jgi:hypothetical protein